MKRVGFAWAERGSCRHPERMTIKGGSLCAVNFPAMVGIIRHPDAGILLFDTGYDQAFLEATRPFPERFYRWATPVALDPADGVEEWLVRQGVRPDEVRHIILSHFHGDHVAGLGGFPNARVFCASAGLERVRSGGRLSRVAKGLLAALVPDDVASRSAFFEDLPVRALPAAFAPFETGRDLLGDGSLLAVELPGHCPGHWGLALRTEDDRFVLLSADSTWSIKAIEREVPPPWVTTMLLGDTKAYRRTLGALHAASANRELVILPSHCAVAAGRLGDGG
jgi:glyoxylase-like metal-dependent hydrolase (beta-lactamase superfamily II)